METAKEISPITWETMPEPDYYPCHLCAKEKAVIHLDLTVNEILFKFTVCKKCSQLSGAEIHRQIKTVKEVGFAKAME